MALVDAKYILDENRNIIDIVFDSDGNQEIDESFDSNITISLGTDARANDKEVQLKQLQRGNLINLFNNINNGSKLWLLSQARLSPETKNLTISYAKNALKWLITDGYLDDVIVTATNTIDGIILLIQLKRLDGAFDNFRFQAWNNSIYRIR